MRKRKKNVRKEKKKFFSREREKKALMRENVKIRPIASSITFSGN